MKKKLMSMLLALVMLLAMLPVGATAVEVPAQEEAERWFTRVGFSSMMTARKDRFYAPGEAAPDGEVFWFVQMADDMDQYLNEETWCFELTYEQYMEVVDRYFVNHSDMKAYLEGEGYYDPATGAVSIFTGGFGDAWSWNILSTYQSGSTYKLQGLFLNQPVEDATGLTENIDYYTYSFEIDGEVYTNTMYIDTVLELTLQDTEDGWKILAYEQGDYYIIERDGDATLYAMDSDKETVSGIYSRVRLFETGASFVAQGQALEDSLAKFEDNDDLWYAADEGFSWEVIVPEGYVLSGVECTTSAGTVSAGTAGTVEPGTGAVELRATADALIDVDASHASVEVLQGLKEYGDRYLYSANDVVELKVEAAAGYEIVSVSMGGVEGQYLESTGTYVIHPDFAPGTLIVETRLKFTDVPKGAFYDEAVQWAVDNGVTSGKTETSFDPNGDCLRAEVVTFLWRAEGCPKAESDVNPFEDVKKSDYYYDAVLWAVEKGITNGADATHFNPLGVCNRAQVVTFLHRTFGAPAAKNTENPFTDVPDGTWYTEPILWAVEMGITNGLSGTQFGPTANCNRAQIVTFLHRAYTD